MENRNYTPISLNFCYFIKLFQTYAQLRKGRAKSISRVEIKSLSQVEITLN